MVNLNRIYTRTGDAGTTRLSDASETSKTDPRVAAYGDVDETNAVLGTLAGRPDLPEELRPVLARIQNELFDVGADLATPLHDAPPWPPLRTDPEAVTRLEQWCDSFGADLPDLTSFILPGGGEIAAGFHLARTVARRAERTGWSAVERHGAQAPGGVNLAALTYLNRLSDLLFVLARYAAVSGDVLWVPGSGREPTDPRARRRKARIEAQQGEL